MRQLVYGRIIGVPMQSGELTVVGSGKANIELGKHHPKYIVVRFKDDHIVIPCNPHHHDHLKWEVRNLHPSHRHDHRHEHCKHDDRYVLEVEWRVTGVRKINWSVYY